MKTNYRPRSSAPAWIKRLVYTCIVLAMAILGGIFLRKLLLEAASPIWKSSNFFSITLDNFFKLIQSKEALIAANQDLGQKLVNAGQEIDSLRAAEVERDTLLSTFGRGATTTGIAASVLVRPPQTPYDILMVDAGSKIGVQQGDKVWLPQGGSIGVIRSVSLTDAQVALFSGSGIETDVVLERGEVPVKLTGQGGGMFKVDVPKSILVVVGDRVLDPGIRGELVGVVGDVSTTPSDSVQHVLVRAMATPSTLRFVLITPH